ncbi:MAG: hypothetical protein AAFR11_04125 [Pseudomonadota bacterium]
MGWAELALSALAVTLLGVLSAALGQWRSAGAGVETASERLALDEPDFEARDWLVSEDGRAALSSDGAGGFALVFALGDRLGSRRWRAGERAAAAEGTELRIAFREPGLGAATLQATDAAEAARWSRLLAGDADKLAR